MCLSFWYNQGPWPYTPWLWKILNWRRVTLLFILYLSKSIRKASLLSVLIAVSNTIKDVGYIQGLNSIAGVFLFHLKEEESFWIMLYFMEKLNFKELLKEDFNRVHILDFQLQVYLDNYVPAVAEHFVRYVCNCRDSPLSIAQTPDELVLFHYTLVSYVIFLSFQNFKCKLNLFFKELIRCLGSQGLEFIIYERNFLFDSTCTFNLP